ncbi:hypothetical protein [Photorhabdus khanii]
MSKLQSALAYRGYAPQ